MLLQEVEKFIQLPKIQPNVVSAEIAEFIIRHILLAGKKGAVIGLSGGIDSTTTAYLCKFAFDDYNKNHDQKLTLRGFLLPSHVNKEHDLIDAKLVADNLQIHFDIIQINGIADSFVKNLHQFIRNHYDHGNLYSEIRAIILSRAAAYYDSLILGTGNRDEDYGLGYFTKRGDGQVDVSPIGDLSKRQVMEVAEFLGVPKRLINRIPTAGLWDGQTDEKELGFSYLEAEIILEAKDRGWSKLDIEEKFNFGCVRKESEFSVLIVDKVLDMHIKNKYKLEMPPIAKVTKFF